MSNFSQPTLPFFRSWPTFGPCLDGCHFLHSHAPLPTPLSSFVLPTFPINGQEKPWLAKFLIGTGLGINQTQPEGSFSCVTALFSHMPPPCDNQILSLPFLVHLPCVVDAEEETLAKFYFPLAPFCVSPPAVSLSLVSFASTSSCCQRNKEQRLPLVPLAPRSSNQRHVE